MNVFSELESPFDGCVLKMAVMLRVNKMNHIALQMQELSFDTAFTVCF